MKPITRYETNYKISIVRVDSFHNIFDILSPNIAPTTTNGLNFANQPIDLRDIETKKIRVNDIEMAYKKFGNGPPILLINGYSAPLDFWDPLLISKLASNHTVITFDNRGIGNTSSGNKQFSIPQCS
ncbi:MAG TPA: alpha/beta hydrolase [Nitrososphaeraceae archaeon]|nr:alpha/beta hydrolase [Nitrososphaeraceae archaeon]